jgi:hypothetical protein
MQLQIECDGLKHSPQTCCICNDQFEPNQAKIILCDEQAVEYGEICPHCLHQGFDWIKQQFEGSYLLKKANRSRYYSKNQDYPKTPDYSKNVGIPVGV